MEHRTLSYWTGGNRSHCKGRTSSAFHVYSLPPPERLRDGPGGEASEAGRTSMLLAGEPGRENEREVR